MHFTSQTDQPHQAAELELFDEQLSCLLYGSMQQQQQQATPSFLTEDDEAALASVSLATPPTPSPCDSASFNLSGSFSLPTSSVAAAPSLADLMLGGDSKEKNHLQQYLNGLASSWTTSKKRGRDEDDGQKKETRKRKRSRKADASRTTKKTSSLSSGPPSAERTKNATEVQRTKATVAVPAPSDSRRPAQQTSVACSGYSTDAPYVVVPHSRPVPVSPTAYVAVPPSPQYCMSSPLLSSTPHTPSAFISPMTPSPYYAPQQTAPSMSSPSLGGHCDSYPSVLFYQPPPMQQCQVDERLAWPNPLILAEVATPPTDAALDAGLGDLERFLLAWDQLPLW